MATATLQRCRHALGRSLWSGENRLLFSRAFAAAPTEEQDLIVIGGGPGGYVGAIKAAQLGMKVTCVEGRGSLGGTCLNVGCIPSKALLQSSHMFYDAQKHFAKHGIKTGGVELDLEAMMAQKDSSVKGLTSGIEGLFKKNKVTYVKGWGSFKSVNEINVQLLDGGETTLRGKNIMIATGSDVASLPGLEIDEERIVSSTGAIALKEVPKDMIVVGGGIIGLEMGSVWSRLGANVTVIEYLPHIVPGMDDDIRKAFERVLKKQGINFKKGHKVLGCERAGERLKLSYEGVKDGKAGELEADIVLVATGRRPFTDGLNLEAVGIETERGRISVDGHFRTKHPNIYAIGDVVPGPMLAHKAEEDGIAAVEIMAGRAGHVNYNTVPGIIYTHPEVAWVGLNDEQCKEQGLDTKSGKFSFMANSRARAVEETDGLVKIIVDKKTDKILGAHIMGANAGELIHECVLAMEYGASAEDIARTCHGHPTLSEAVKEAALAAYDKPIHM